MSSQLGIYSVETGQVLLYGPADTINVLWSTIINNETHPLCYLVRYLITTYTNPTHVDSQPLYEPVTNTTRETAQKVLEDMKNIDASVMFLVAPYNP